MKRRTWILLAIAVIVAAGATGGSLVAVGLGGDSGGRAPAGAETVLRIQPVEDEVPCGPGPVVVHIYLDDLAARASPWDADASYGVAGFEFPLRYDPEVLRLGEPVDVQLNPELDLEDADGDGVARSFVPVIRVDDGAGYAALGAASFNPSSQGSPEANREEGLDPVAKGGPLLLMTVRFQTVGQGSSALTMEPREGREASLVPRVLDPNGDSYEPVTVKTAGLTVRGGECPEVAPATPRPTPGPTSTPFVPPTPTLPVWRTVTPADAPSTGRGDCPGDWVVYSDPQDRFSICYPADLNATASDFAVNIHRTPMAEENRGSLSFAISWASTSAYSVIGQPSPDTCEQYAVMGQTSSEFVELSLSGQLVPACFNKGVLEGSEALSIASLKGEIPLARDGSDRDGFVSFYAGYVAADVTELPPLVESVLGTLLVNYR